MDCLVKDTQPEIPAQSVLNAMRALFACEKSAEMGSALVDVE